MTRIHIGTSGWSYDHWRGPFYPPELTSDQWLNFYALQFNAVEINNTFYRLPSRATLETWCEQIPVDFVFACKASRYITHMKKLTDPQDNVPRFLRTIEALGDKLGPILFQLPPRWRMNLQRLNGFLEALPATHRYAFEFRDDTWFTADVTNVLRKHGMAMCVYDLNGRTSPVEATADFAYVRLHGPDGPYRGQYDERSLAGWVERFRGWLGEGRDVFCFFDNDEKGYAAQDARRMCEMVDRASTG